jgi:hypothetical protein
MCKLKIVFKKLKQWLLRFNNVGIIYRRGFEAGFSDGQRYQYWKTSHGVQESLGLIQKSHHVITYNFGAIYACTSTKDHDGPCAMEHINPFELDEN